MVLNCDWQIVNRRRRLEINRKAGVILVAIGLLFIILGAGRRAKKEVGLELIWEKKFDKQIEEVAFGETEDGKLYPKIVVFEHEVRFYDEEGDKLKVVSSSWPNVIISPRSHYIGIEKILERYEKGGKISEWTIYTDRGKEVWKAQHKAKYEFEGFRMYSISDEGYFVMGNSSDHFLEFLNEEGERLKEVDIFKNDQWDPDRALPRDFSKDGEYLVVLATERFIMDVRDKYHSDEEKQSPNVYVILFDKTGVELWRKPFSVNWTRHVSWSPDGNFIIAVGHGPAGQQPVTHTQALFDENGRLISKYHVRMHDGSYNFSESGEYLVLGGENEIQLGRTFDNEVMWRQEFPWPIDSRKQEWKWVKSVGVADDGTVVALANRYERYRNSDGSGGYFAAETEVMLFNRNGELLYQKNVEGAKFLKINPQGKEIFVTAKDALGKIAIR